MHAKSEKVNFNNETKAEIKKKRRELSQRS